MAEVVIQQGEAAEASHAPTVVAFGVGLGALAKIAETARDMQNADALTPVRDDLVELAQVSVGAAAAVTLLGVAQVALDRRAARRNDG